MTDPNFERTFRHSLSEAKVVGIVWLVALLWTVGYGYFRTDSPAESVLGMPSGIFWGIAAPWSACTLFTAAYALFFMHDDDLEAGTGS